MDPDFKSFHKSINSELQTVKNRVRNLIGDKHWQKEGEYKEEIFKKVLGMFLPESFAVGSGFVIGIDKTPTRQIDVIVYDTRYPVLFRQADFVILPPDGVRAIIEVKTKLSKTKLKEAIEHASDNGRIILLSHQNRTFHFFNGIFAYEQGNEKDIPQTVDDCINSFIFHEPQGPNLRPFQKISCCVNHLSIGRHVFIKLWNEQRQRERLSAYELRNLAASYFIFNLVSDLQPDRSHVTDELIFPLDSKEIHRIYDKPYTL